MARSEERSAPVRGFEPNWSTHPGEHIEEYLEVRGWSQAEFARLACLTPKLVSEIIRGKNPVTPDTAVKLERVLGLKAYIWLGFQASWDLHLAKQRQKEITDKDKAWLEQFPIRKLKKRGWLPDTRDHNALLGALLKFLGIGEPSGFEERLASLGVRHRQSRAYKTSDHHIAAWLAIGEHRAREMDLPAFDVARFLKSVQQIRSFTTEPPEVFEPRMKALCKEAGVALILEPELPKTRLFGSTHWMERRNPIIQLSLRMKANDHFWWTLFHEAGHIVLHSGKTFLDEGKRGEDACECDADNWALERLVGRERFKEFKSRKPRSEAAVRCFALSVGLHPGIIVGMLQHDRVLPHSHLNAMKMRLDWAER